MLERFSRLLIGLLVAGAAALQCGCGRTVREPSALIAPPGATDVRWVRFVGTDQLTCKLKERYPARAALQSISGQLAKQGWRPMKEDSLNPGLPSSHVRGWTEFVDGTRKPEEYVRRWGADWTNAHGDVVRYCLDYRSRLGGPENLDTLGLAATYTPAKLARATRESVLKEMKKQRRDSTGP